MNLEYIVVILTLVEKGAEAWDLIDKHSARLNEARYDMTRRIGDVVSHYEKKKQFAKAFSAGADIIKEIRERDAVFTPHVAMQAFLTGLLEEEVKIELVAVRLPQCLAIFRPLWLAFTISD